MPARQVLRLRGREWHLALLLSPSRTNAASGRGSASVEARTRRGGRGRRRLARLRARDDRGGEKNERKKTSGLQASLQRRPGSPHRVPPVEPELHQPSARKPVSVRAVRRSLPVTRSTLVAFHVSDVEASCPRAGRLEGVADESTVRPRSSHARAGERAAWCGPDRAGRPPPPRRGPRPRRDRPRGAVGAGQAASSCGSEG